MNHFKELYGKEDSGQAVRQRNDDESGVLQFHTFGPSTEIEALEAHLRLSAAIEAAKQKQEQKT